MGKNLLFQVYKRMNKHFTRACDSSLLISKDIDLTALEFLNFEMRTF
jgi:hypothetical protein